MTTNKRNLNARPQGQELFEITPIILGGSPTDPKNKVWLSRQQHIQAVRYWNRIIRKMREESNASS